MVRLLPSVTTVLLGILRPALAPIPVRSLMPDLGETVPVVMARRAGGTALHPEFADTALVDGQCWHTTDADAEALADACRAALYRAWRTQQVVPDAGSIARWAEQSAPVLIPDDDAPKGIYRYQALYQLTIRPDRR